HDAQTAFTFLHDVAVRRHGEQHVLPFAVSIDFIGQLPLAHFFDLRNLSAPGSDDAFNLRIDLVDLFLRSVRIHDKHDFVVTHLCPLCPRGYSSGAFCLISIPLNSAMLLTMPSVSRLSTALTAIPSV